PISAVADDERDALLGVARADAQQYRQHRPRDERSKAHGRSPRVAKKRAHPSEPDSRLKWCAFPSTGRRRGFRSAQSGLRAQFAARRSAAQRPEQVLAPPEPCQTPEAALRAIRPVPSARASPYVTLTRTAPFSPTWPLITNDWSPPA